MIWAALVHDLYEPLNHVVHCTDAAEIFHVAIEHTEGEASTVEVERAQQGWMDMIFGGPRNILISESVTNLPEDAVVIARARINRLPSQVMSETQILNAICAPSDIKEKLLTFAKTHLLEGSDFRFSDADPEDPSSYLLTRSAVFHIDPATHEISITDDLHGDRVIVLDDIALIGDEGPEESDGVYGEPVSTLKAKLTVGWTETRRGQIDIASQIGNAGVIQSLDPSIVGRLASSIVSAGSEGWTLMPNGLDVTQTSYRHSTTAGVEVGSTYRVNLQKFDSQEIRDKDNQLLATIRNLRTTPIDNGTRAARAIFKQHTYRVRRFLMGYDYQQDRVEHLFASLSVPVHSQVVFSDEAEILEFSIDDLLGDPDAAEYRTGQAYELGDEVFYNGRYYRCVEDHYSEFFDELRDNGTSYWQSYVPAVGFTTDGLTRVLDAERGRSIVDHLFGRLWTEGRRRSRFRHFSVPLAWDDARGIKLTDSVSLRVPTNPLNPQLFHVITGKVVRISRDWNPDGEQLAVVEFAVSALSGTSDDAPDEPKTSWYVTGDPVDPTPRFSVRSVEVTNEASDQLGRVAQVAGMQGRAPEDVTVVFPTTIKITMNPIAARPTLEREIDATGLLTAGAKGGIARG